VQRLVESRDESDWKLAEDLLKNDDALLKKCNLAIEAIKKYKEALQIGLVTWDSLRLTAASKRRSFAESYGTLLETGLAKSSLTKEMILAFKYGHLGFLRVADNQGSSSGSDTSVLPYVP
jgi:hypothetical protein